MVAQGDVTSKYASFTEVKNRRDKYQLAKIRDVDIKPSPFLATQLGLPPSGKLPEVLRRRADSTAKRRKRRTKLQHPPSPLAIPRAPPLPDVGYSGKGLSPVERRAANERLVLPRVDAEAAMLAQRQKIREVLFPDRRSSELDALRLDQLNRINNIIMEKLPVSQPTLSGLRSRVGGGVGSWIVRQSGATTSTMDILRYTPLRRRKGSAAFEVIDTKRMTTDDSRRGSEVTGYTTASSDSQRRRSRRSTKATAITYVPAQRATATQYSRECHPQERVVPLLGS